MSQNRLLELKSLEGSVRLYDDRLEADNILGSNRRVIPYTQIDSVQLEKTSTLAKATWAYFTAGVSLMATNKKRLIIKSGIQTTQIEFRAEPLAKVKKAIEIINEGIQQGSRPNVAVNLPNDAGRRGSAADELTKLAKLKRDGIITQAEFDAAKKKLLELG